VEKTCRPAIPKASQRTLAVAARSPIDHHAFVGRGTAPADHFLLKAEHPRLKSFDVTHEGWARYIAAGVPVIDTSTGNQADPSALEAGSDQRSSCGHTEGADVGTTGGSE
jgi:hypothetical protein